MTDKEILKQLKGADKIKPYAVDTAAIRRGKANLALMMTLTTADHYDWFIGKFPAHNYFEYYGYYSSLTRLFDQTRANQEMIIVLIYMCGRVT